MKPLYMLDTNMCIYLIRNRPTIVAARFAACYEGEVVMSAVTLAELEYGVVCSGANQPQNREALDSLLEDIVPAPFDAEAAKVYGPIRRATRERKRDALDKMIAAHAVALDVTLVTNNEAAFPRYPGLRVENWLTLR